MKCVPSDDAWGTRFFATGTLIPSPILDVSTPNINNFPQRGAAEGPIGMRDVITSNAVGAASKNPGICNTDLQNSARIEF